VAEPLTRAQSGCRCNAECKVGVTAKEAEFIDQWRCWWQCTQLEHGNFSIL